MFLNYESIEPKYFYLFRGLSGIFYASSWAVNFSIVINWFPRKMRGLIIGLWSLNGNIGDIAGILFYNSQVSTPTDWGYPFYAIGFMYFVLGIINVSFLPVYPAHFNLYISEYDDLLTTYEDSKARVKNKGEFQANENTKTTTITEAFSLKHSFGLIASFFLLKFMLSGISFWLAFNLEIDYNYS
jgi:sugar phosphate permease